MDTSRLTFSFDIGHSSIGWAVLTQNRPHPDIVGCGSLIFPKDDCLASHRRAHRRARRNIRSTRQRISRMRSLLLHLGVLSASQLDSPGHPAPHVLAARALAANAPSTLTWMQLWHVLRWYAHNRGYDGNTRWARSGGDEDGDDTDKEKAALALMAQHGTTSMAATVCAVLGIDPTDAKISSSLPYKTLNAAFPRSVVRSEVIEILQRHIDRLPELKQDFIDCLIASDETTGHRAWQTIRVPDIQLPKRYFGGLLFGQLIPRFDNRIIGKCPMTGEKLPNKATISFYRYRWAMILANLKADGNPLPTAVRRELNEFMEVRGRLTKTELRGELERLTQTKDTNAKAFFELHPDSEDALVLDPALALFNGYGRGAKAIQPFWNLLPEIPRKRACGRWKKGRRVTVEWMLDQCRKEGAASAFEAHIVALLAETDKGKPKYASREILLRKAFAPETPSGRAPYCRTKMDEVVDFVLSTDRHPTEAEKGSEPAGPIYRSKDVLKAERDRPIEDATNNHLIRQRLGLLLRLADDMVVEYAGGDGGRVRDIVVEVARDLQQYSGLTAKEMSGELTKRLSHFKSAVKYLDENVPDMPVNGSLIRKCRIAMDLDWRCPFTGKRFSAARLPEMELEHIIPYSDRPTNALDALVLTFDWVNKLKAKRTAFRFIEDVAEDARFHTPQQFKTFVDKLKVAKKDSYPDDFRRQSARKKWLMIDAYEKKDHGFTAGALTQTSHLNRLSARQLEKRFSDPVSGDCTVRIHSIPGQVTAETRYHWKLLHTLDKACPECGGKTKTEIRDITHLHHALDAATVGLVAHYLPGSLPGQAENEKGKIWQAMLKRRQGDEEIALLMRTGVFATRPSKSNGKLHAELIDLPADLKNRLADRLAECRVVQHVPADQSGAKLEETTWRYLGVHDGQAVVAQMIARTGREATQGSTHFGWKDAALKKDAKKLLPLVSHLLTRKQIQLVQRGLLKLTTEPLRSLVGLEPGKLSQNKAVRVIGSNFGIALMDPPELIPFHSVASRLRDIARRNGGKLPPVLRNGILIDVPKGTWKGRWRVSSVKESRAYGVSVDLEFPERTFKGKGNAKIPDMVADGLEIIDCTLVGIPLLHDAG